MKGCGVWVKDGSNLLNNMVHGYALDLLSGYPPAVL